MQLGLESYSTRNSGLDPIGVLELTSELGLDGVCFELSPFSSFRDEYLRSIRATAADKGLYLEFGMGSIFRWHVMAEKGVELLADAGHDISVSPAEIVVHHLKIAEKLGSPILRCVAGNLFTRDEGQDMQALADEAVSILREACPVAEDMGIKIAMENHADFTVREGLGILARVDSPAFGFTVDCGNLAFDLDDPVGLAKMMAPHALTTHFKNYRVLRTPEGLALGNCPLGDGDLDLVSIAGVLAEHRPEMRLNIEIHSQFAPFRLDILDETFFARHPSPPGSGLAWYLEKAWARDIEELPDNLEDGEASWPLEYEHVKRSAAWARENLAHLLSS